MKHASEIQGGHRVFFEDNGPLVGFKTITLPEMDRVKLLARFDSKYSLSRTVLNKILDEVRSDYYVLEIEGVREHAYESVYYDTKEDRFFLDHHNGRASRMKVRKRVYIDSGLAFLEIKQKSNKGKTTKTRMRIEQFRTLLSPKELEFIYKNTGLTGEKLLPRFQNRFDRITLVSKNFSERCTIDSNLELQALLSAKCKIDDMVIVELKQENPHSYSKLAEVLKEHRIYRSSFSKYCMGRALNEKSIKRNLFKANILRLQKQYTLHTI
ncbi:polyphosphate polymerase domain-containing protein [Maribellus sediminis]|uniref:polyphosphate polymerase domain-containing protein n=1 Tax=Maribellus sediminis TaxID=2696285 RepID=UPI0014307A40|nr:polyphosphate polymerase domain-containing protein [Maribellus sediminis]